MSAHEPRPGYADVYSKRKQMKRKLQLKRPPVKQQPSAHSAQYVEPDPELPIRKLSDAIKAFPPGDLLKISLVEKGIQHLDQVDGEFAAHCETLFISNNSIDSIHGATQFRNLRTLSAASNCLESLDDISTLTRCANLQILNLENNPVTYTPNYRCHVINALTALRLLDNKEVTKRERNHAVVVARKEDTMLNVMYTNYCVASKLQKSIDKLRLHAELRSVVFGRMSVLNRTQLPRVSNFETRQLLNAIDADNYHVPERETVFAELRSEVQKVWRLRSAAASKEAASRRRAPKRLSPSAQWDAAFTEVMLQQQHTVARLLGRLEEERMKIQDVEARLRKYDPSETIQSLRVNEERSALESRRERESLISEFRSNIVHLLDDFRSDFGAQATDYERKIRDLQSQMTGLTSTIAFHPSTADGSVILGGGGDGRGGPGMSEIHQRSAVVPPESLEISHVLGLDDDSALPSHSTVAASSHYQRPRTAQRAGHASASRQSMPRSSSLVSLSESLPPQQTVDDDEGSVIPTRGVPDMEMDPAAIYAHQLSATTGSALPQPHQQHDHSQSGGVAQQGPVAQKPPMKFGLDQGQGKKSARQRRMEYSDRSSKSELLSQIEHLQRDIEHRSELEAKLHAINGQLREKLELFEQANQDNVMLSRQDLDALNNDIDSLVKRTEELSHELEVAKQDKETAVSSLQQNLLVLQEERDELVEQASKDEVSHRENVQVLETQMSGLKAQIKLLQTKIAENDARTVELQKQAETMRQTADKYAFELRLVLADSERTELASQFYDEALRRRVFKLFKKGIAISRRQSKKLAQHESVRDGKLLKKTLVAWRLHVYRVKVQSSAVRARRTACAHRCLMAWIGQVQMSKIVARARRRRLLGMAGEVIRRWRLYVADIRQEKTNTQIAYLHHRATTLVKGWRSWKQFTNRLIVPVEIERPLLQRASEHCDAVRLSTHFRALVDYMRGPVAARRRLVDHCSRHWAQVTLSDAFSQWQVSFKLHQRQTALQATCAMRFYPAILRRYLERWKAYVTQVKHIREARRIVELGRAKKMLRAWQVAMDAAVDRKQVLMRAFVHGDTCQVRRAFLAWRRHTREMRVFHHHAGVIMRVRAANMKKRFMNVWRDVVDGQNRDREIQSRHERALTSRYLAQWKGFVALRRQSRQHKQDVIDFHERHRYAMVKLTWTAWRGRIARREAEKEAINLFRRRHGVSLQNRALAAWSMQFSSAVCAKYVALQRTHEDVANAHQENLDLLERVQSLTAELAGARQQLADKETEIVHMNNEASQLKTDRARLNEQLRIEKSVSTDRAEQFRNLQTSVREHQEVAASDAVQQAADLQEAQASIAHLRALLDDKSSALANTEDRLLNATEQLGLRVEAQANASAHLRHSTFSGLRQPGLSASTGAAYGSPLRGHTTSMMDGRSFAARTPVDPIDLSAPSSPESDDSQFDAIRGEISRLQSRLSARLDTSVPDSTHSLLPPRKGLPTSLSDISAAPTPPHGHRTGFTGRRKIIGDLPSVRR